MTAPDRIYRGVTVGGRIVYQDDPPTDDQSVWPWEEYTRATPAALSPEVAALVDALKRIAAGMGGYSAAQLADAALRGIESQKGTADDRI